MEKEEKIKMVIDLLTRIIAFGIMVFFYMGYVIPHYGEEKAIISLLIAIVLNTNSIVQAIKNDRRNPK